MEDYDRAMRLSTVQGIIALLLFGIITWHIKEQSIFVGNYIRNTIDSTMLAFNESISTIISDKKITTTSQAVDEFKIMINTILEKIKNSNAK